MSPIETVLDKLPGAKRSGNGWSVRCPAHEDKRASLSVSEGNDGKVLLNCHAGCETGAILSAVGLTWGVLYPANAGPTSTGNGKPKSKRRTFPALTAAVAELGRQLGKRSALWTYYDAQGEPMGAVVRWDTPSGKEIRPVARQDNGWQIGAMPEPRPLYALPELSKTKLVIVVEGEKAADAARTLGFMATTSAGGSQAPGKTDWRPLAGKEVWILPDNDAPGRKYANAVAKILAELTPVPAVRVVQLLGLPESGDIVDWIDAHGDAAEPDGMLAEIEDLARAVELWRTEKAADQDREADLPTIMIGTDEYRVNDEAAKALNVGVGTVKTLIHRLRKRYIEIVRQEVGRTVSDPAEINSEIHALCDALIAAEGRSEP